MAERLVIFPLTNVLQRLAVLDITRHPLYVNGHLHLHAGDIID